MRIPVRVVLCLAAAVAFAAAPVYAQHGASASGMSHSTDHPTAHSNSTKGSGSKGSSVSEKLTDNTKLAGKLQSLLPTGTDLQLAAQGYKNLGQFVAAVHVSHNLGIPFDELKAKMIGPPKESLGHAIHALKPAASATQETKKGKKQAKQDINDSQAS